jgi:hypothetical protein
MSNLIDFAAFDLWNREHGIVPFTDDRYLMNLSRSIVVANGIKTETQPIPAKLFSDRLMKMFEGNGWKYVGIYQGFHIFLID